MHILAAFGRLPKTLCPATWGRETHELHRCCFRCPFRIARRRADGSRQADGGRERSHRAQPRQPGCRHRSGRLRHDGGGEGDPRQDRPAHGRRQGRLRREEGHGRVGQDPHRPADDVHVRGQPPPLGGRLDVRAGAECTAFPPVFYILQTSKLDRQLLDFIQNPCYIVYRLDYY